MKLNRSTRSYSNLRVVTFLLLFILMLQPLLIARGGAAGPGISSASIPLTGSVRGITLNGQIHLVTRTQIPMSPNPCKLDIYATIPTAEIQAFDASGNQYLVHGASNIMGLTYPAGTTYPSTPAIPDMGFSLDPLEIGQGQGGRINFLVHFDLRFTSAGELMPAASSAKVSCAQDGC